MFTISSSGRPFGPDGCEVPVGQSTCGETRTLDIINEFRRLYEEKLAQIDNCGGGDCLQEKLRLQQDWIGDLTAQNEMLVKAVEELEHEATERVNLLEKKLQQSAQGICEVMKRYREYDVTNELLDKPLQKVFSLENDRKNMLEFIRRVREEKRWDVNGLTFYEVSYRDLFGACKKNGDTRQSSDSTSNPTGCMKGEARLKDRECNIQELQQKIKYYDSFGDVESICKELECKKEECISLQRSMKDTQHALVEEIASKHDVIVQLKKEVQQLEERCIQADKQTAFRDDIIKELRKEIKQLKQQMSLPEKPFKNSNVIEPIRTDSSGESYLVINHTKKIVQSGKSTVIYLKKDGRDKPEEINSKNPKPYEKHTNTCARCRKKRQDKMRMSQGTQTVDLDCFYIDDNLLSSIEDMLEDMNKVVEVKDQQLRRQLDLIKILVSKLFYIDNCLQYLQRRASSVVQTLDKENGCLKGTIKENRCQLESLARDFKDFVLQLKSKDELKQKSKASEKKYRMALVENEKFRNEIASIKTINSQLEKEFDSVKEEFEKYKTDSEVYEAKIQKLSKENERIMNEMIHLNDEITQEEVTKLNATIDELQNDLQRTKHVQDKEEKINLDKIASLEETIRNLTNDLAEIEEKFEKECKVCKICRRRVKVGFAENAEVDCYLNSIEQQKLTIANLQKALVAAKQDLDEVRQRSQENVSYSWASRWFGSSDPKPTSNNQKSVHDV
ncbi:hypothetical protein NQ317_012317 [Molorchus minor]|uniref:Uncharacterized protein n=1 Tax=Molorchus minor TaxID=1323400 RepID=A0ABQ9J3R1_9CUCU|nr:hypothetical protein NQ317_012317 [Molorchus minor]